jgi:O-antigen/teichoic acid export membrane protein
MRRDSEPPVSFRAAAGLVDRSSGRDVGPYLTLMVAASLLALAKGFLFARVLGARDFSTYAVLDLVVTFGTQLGSLGLLEGLNRDLPLLLGAGRHRRARMLTARGAGAVLILSVAVLLLYLAAVELSVRSDTRLRVTLMLGGFLSAATNILIYLSVQLLAHRRSVAFAGMMVLKNGSVLLLGWALSRQFGLWGAIGGEISAVVAVIVLAAWPLRAFSGIRVGPLRHLRGVFRIGAPLMLGALTGNLGRNLDRLTVAVGLTVPLFGQYSFAMLLGLGGTVLLNILVQYVTPRVCAAVGAGSTLASQLRSLDRLVLFLLLAGGLGYPFFLWLANGFLVNSFPGFRDAFLLMRLVYFGACVQVGLIYQSLLVAAGWSVAIFRQSAIVAGLSLLLCLTALTFRAAPIVYAEIFVAHRFFAAVLAFLDARRAVAEER